MDNELNKNQSKNQEAETEMDETCMDKEVNVADNNTEGEELSAEDALVKMAAAYAELEKKTQAVDEQMLRLQADFDNFRRRTRAEKEEWTRNITADFCSELLPVIDNFGRALQALRQTGADESHLQGVEMIARQLGELLIAKGVEKIPTVGEDFDPNWHEAVGRVEVEDEAQVGKVMAEFQAGYRLGGKALRVAMVQVGVQAQ